MEYNLLTYNYSNANSTLRTVSSSGFDAFYRDEVSSFDIALSASSFDHDGLGTLTAFFLFLSFFFVYECVLPY